jgi:hypothetical protein
MDDPEKALAEAQALIETSLALLDQHGLAADAGVHLSLGLHHLEREAERRHTGGGDVSAN